LSLDGIELSLVPAGTFGLMQLPDEHPTYLQLGPGNDRWWLAANARAEALSTSDFTTFSTVVSYQNGNAAPVLSPSNPLSSAFDADYVGPGSVVYANNGTDLLMVYHAENHYGVGSVPTGPVPFYASVGLARSSDGGVTWTRTTTPIVTGSQPQKPSPPAGVIALGATSPAILETNGYLYLFFKDVATSRSSPSGVQEAFCIARAPSTSDASPGSWKKYFHGAFSAPGVGGSCDDILRAPVAPATGKACLLFPAPTFNKYLNKYVMVFEDDDGFYVATSRDLLNWSTPTRFFTFQTPRSVALKTPGREYYAYPLMVSPNETSEGVTDQTGYLFYAKGIQNQKLQQNDHGLFRQSFSLSVSGHGR
jgi:hypothetical protein